jgi:hypothetical protein
MTAAACPCCKRPSSLYFGKCCICPYDELKILQEKIISSSDYAVGLALLEKVDEMRADRGLSIEIEHTTTTGTSTKRQQQLRRLA